MSLPFPVSRFLFPVSCNFRAACGLFAAGLLLSCGTTEEPSVDETVTMAASVESEPLIGDGDIPSRPPVAMSWGMTDGSHVAGKFDPFRVTLRNERMEKVEVALSMVGTGLDQRMVKVDVGTFHLKDLESHQIDIPIESLPIQSVGAPAQIELTATCSGAGWMLELPAERVYVQFTPDFSKVHASTTSTWAPVALGLSGGDVSSKAFQTLLQDPMSAVRADASKGGGDPDAVDLERAKSLYESLVRPVLEPVGRYVDDTGTLVDLIEPRTGGGMLPVTREQAALLETVLIHAAPAVPTNPAPLDFPLIGRTVRMCAKWGVQYNDSGLGEDYLNGVGHQLYPARFAKGQIRRLTPNVQDFWAGQFDFDGCAPTMFLPYAQYYLYVEPNFTTTNNTKFRVTGDNASQFWAWWLPFTIGSLPPVLALSTANHEASRIGAVVSTLLSNWDPGVAVVSNKNYRLVASTTDCEQTGAFSRGEYVCYGFDPGGGPHTTISKIVIAHEIAHSLDASGSGTPYNTYYWELTGVPACRCDHVLTANQLHCIQSWEQAGGAFIEGFAQFYAAKVFNEWRHTDCVFAYYKEFRQDNGVVLMPPVAMSCRTNHRWMKNHCDYSAQSGGVEMDWMTYFWNVHAPQEYGNKRISMQEYHLIKRKSCTGSTGSLCSSAHQLDFETWRVGALDYFGSSSNLKFQHVRDMGYLHGVNRY